MGAHARRGGSVQADAFGQTSVIVLYRRRCHRGCLSNLDLHSVAVPQEDELAGGLEVVPSPIHGADVRVALIGSIVISADLEPENSLVLTAVGVRRGDIDVLVARRVSV